MNAAMLAWNESNLTEFKNLLDRYFPQAGEPDLRKWEWYHMGHLGKPYFQARRIELPDVAQGVVFVPKHNLIAVAHGFAPVVSIWNLGTGDCQAQLGHALSARWIETFVAVSPDGERLA